MYPGSGVLFHSRGQSFSLKAATPTPSAPRKRPMHTIIPGMVTRDGRAVMPFGVMGGHYQAMGHAHFLSKLFDHRLDLQSAMGLPRLFPLPGTATIEMEARLPVIDPATEDRIATHAHPAPHQAALGLSGTGGRATDVRDPSTPDRSRPTPDREPGTSAITQPWC